MGWAEKAREVVAAARAEGERLGLQGKALLDHVDAAYPFGPRECHPYQAWLRARRLHCADLPGVRPLPGTRGPGEHAPPAPMPGQLDLFGGGDGA